MSNRKHMLMFLRWSIEGAVCVLALIEFVPATLNVVQNRFPILFTPNRPMRPVGPIETFWYHISPWIMAVTLICMLPFVIHLISWWSKSRRRALLAS